jgi:hypothetical protein
MHRFAKLGMAGALAAVALGGVSAPAEAHVGAGGAIIAGLAGLGIGAAIASDRPHHRYYAYDAGPPPPPAYGQGYGQGYGPEYGAGYGEPTAYEGYGYQAPRCRVVPRWNGWEGRYVPTRRCW